MFILKEARLHSVSCQYAHCLTVIDQWNCQRRVERNTSLRFFLPMIHRGIAVDDVMSGFSNPSDQPFAHAHLQRPKLADIFTQRKTRLKCFTTNGENRKSIKRHQPVKAESGSRKSFFQSLRS